MKIRRNVEMFLPDQTLKFLFTLFVLLFLAFESFCFKSDFSYLIFSQRWLASSCTEYKEKNSSSNYCVLQQKYDRWAIHGLWPTQNDHLGPFFCNKSSHFNINALSLIRTELELAWPNIEGGKSISSLWKHEWEKHGTCAAEIPSLGSEFKYFQSNLNFSLIYNIEEVFKKSNIYPDDFNGLKVLQIFSAIRQAFGKNPHINCITEKETKEAYLSEIRICFDKELKLIDCEIYPDEKSRNGEKVSNTITNCPLNDFIKIPKTVDPQKLGFQKDNTLEEREIRNKKILDLLLLLKVLKLLA